MKEYLEDKKISSIVYYVILISILGIFFTLGIRLVVKIQLYASTVSGTSMENTLHDEGKIIQIGADYVTLRRGDIVTIETEIEGETSYIVKRIIGMPNEQIEIHGEMVKVNWMELEEPYAYYYEEGKDNISMFLGEDEYFCMGDNRIASLDSREIGPINIKEIKGKVIKYE